MALAQGVVGNEERVLPDAWVFLALGEGLLSEILNMKSAVRFKIIKLMDDPICTRISLGGTKQDGFYCVYRGSLNDVREILMAVHQSILQLDEEPPVSSDDIVNGHS